MADNYAADPKGLSFEKAMRNSNRYVKRLEEGKVPLRNQFAIYERVKR